MTYLHRFTACIMALLITLALIHYSNLDLKFQSLFFENQTKLWLVARDNMVLKFFFYKLPKYIIVSYGIIIILWAVKLSYCRENIELQKKLLFLILILILTPLTVAILKHYSPIYCPNFVKEFGGDRLYISPFDMFNEAIFFNHTGKCFPAGHASGGFALLSLYFVMPNRALKISALVFSLSLGWIMGLYQIAKGTHYLSDTLVTLAIAYLLCISLQQLLLERKINCNIICHKSQQINAASE